MASHQFTCTVEGCDFTVEDPDEGEVIAEAKRHAVDKHEEEVGETAIRSAIVQG